VDPQSVKESAEGVVPAATSGYDRFKNVNGRKRHLVVDTGGLLIAVAVTPASTADRVGAALALKAARAAGRARLARVWADKAYDGDWRHWAQRALGVTIEVVNQPRGGKGFHVLPRRWVVERTHAWITRRRRCARDYERLPAHHQAWVYLAAIYQMTRRLTKTRDDNPDPDQGLETASIARDDFTAGISRSWRLAPDQPTVVPGGGQFALSSRERTVARNGRAAGFRSCARGLGLTLLPYGHEGAGSQVRNQLLTSGGATEAEGPRFMATGRGPEPRKFSYNWTAVSGWFCQILRFVENLVVAEADVAVRPEDICLAELDGQLLRLLVCASLVSSRS